MSLSVQGMKDFIYPPMKNLYDASQATKIFCENICEYINKNAVITYSWSAINSSGNPDPITIFKTNSTGKGYIELSNITTIGAGINYWCTQMSFIIKTKMRMETPDTWVLAPMLFNQSGQLSIVMGGETNFEIASTNFCNQFLTSFKSSFLNPIPVSGIRLNYSGTATMISIE